MAAPSAMLTYYLSVPPRSIQRATLSVAGRLGLAWRPSRWLPDWAVQAVFDGALSLDDLRTGSRATCTLPTEAKGAAGMVE